VHKSAAVFSHSFIPICQMAALVRRALAEVCAVPVFLQHVSKNVPPSTCYNLDIRDPITIIFGTSVIEKIRNQTMLCFPTSPIYSASAPILRSRCRHYVFTLWFLLSFFLPFYLFPRLITVVADWMSAILPHMVLPYCEFKIQV